MTMMRATMTSETLTIFDEPVMEFEGKHYSSDPHDGLALFGAMGSASGTTPPPYAVIGTRQGIDLWGEWCRAFNRSAAVDDPSRHVLWRPFPTYEVAFGSRWSEQPLRTYELAAVKLLGDADNSDQHARCYAVVNHYLDQFETIKKHDELPRVVMCIVPDKIWKNCRPLSRVSGGPSISHQEKRLRQAGQTDFFDSFEPEQYSMSPDFRRQIKARSMRADIPVQIVRESTLRLSDTRKAGERQLTPLSDRLWNLSTALYFKTGKKPWCIRDVRPGVCYVGIAFRRDFEASTSACCAAQMFVDSGDGLVFLGDFGPWYSPEKNQFHLSTEAAQKLLSDVLRTYEAVRTPTDPKISEVFLHSRSSISRAECQGYQAACDAAVKLVGIRVRSDFHGLRLFRPGNMPVLRGTFLQRGDRSAHLFASGFKPRLGTYDGGDVPAPLRIDVQHGDADVGQVGRDILALTKLNYNACRYGSAQPVTVKFSDAVGEILISNKAVEDRRNSFKYYI